MDETTKYYTFWPRLFAVIIDVALFVVFVYVEHLFLGIEYSRNDDLLDGVNMILYPIYFITMHGFYGQTLGKMIARVKVVNNKDEQPIMMQQAFERELPNLVLNIKWITLTTCSSLSCIQKDSASSDIEYAITAFLIVSTVWGISELVTVLFNKKRRAIHDFIGKTVVVRI